MPRLGFLVFCLSVVNCASIVKSKDDKREAEVVVYGNQQNGAAEIPSEYLTSDDKRSQVHHEESADSSTESRHSQESSRHRPGSRYRLESAQDKSAVLASLERELHNAMLANTMNRGVWMQDDFEKVLDVAEQRNAEIDRQKLPHTQPSDPSH